MLSRITVLVVFVVTPVLCGMSLTDDPAVKCALYHLSKYVKYQVNDISILKQHIAALKACAGTEDCLSGTDDINTFDGQQSGLPEIAAPDGCDYDSTGDGTDVVIEPEENGGGELPPDVTEAPEVIPAPEGLVGLWPLMGDAIDKSGNGNDIDVPDNGISYDATEDDGSGAYYFVNGYMEIPNTINAEYSISILARVKFGRSNRGMVFSFLAADDTLAVRIYRNRFSSLLITLKDRDSDMEVNLDSKQKSIQPVEWHDIAFTYDYQSGNAKFYIDQVEAVSEDFGTMNLDTGVKAVIGSDPAGNAYKGYFKCLQIYDHALNLFEIKSAQPDGGCPNAPPS
ncbi:uncharacterized protein LOC100367982 [Saccoglossus kowalevskii]|uniref:Uncharacterized protein LOC100367982 n=1 Tax=Saccoglossus kowalevskii TaxID=10224 RepID=A0ABM0GR54_SACKO|nr:PREDICTED: uncharacterized protein LOC100367982 [Saccoglossus kowalevskii]